MTRPLIAVSANQAWNLVNFRKKLIATLLDRGFAVAAIAAVTNDRDRQCVETLRMMGCDFHPVRLQSMGMRPLDDLRTLADYARLFRSLRPAAYLGWTIKPNIYGALAARLFGIPAIANISGLGSALMRPGPVAWLARALYRLSLKRAATILFQNGDDRDEFVGRGLVRAEQARVVNGSGVDTLFFAPPHGGRDRRGTFLMIARLIGDKGVREYAAAARRLKAREPGLTFRLLGFLDVENRTAMSRDELDGWIVEGIIDFHPPVEDVRPIIAAADCLVLPSYREGTSRVLLEGAAMARPLVATDVPGCREVVTDGVNGHLCQVRDAESLAQAMWKIYCTDDRQWTAMGQASRRLVVEHYSEGAVIDTYLAALAAAGVTAR